MADAEPTRVLLVTPNFDNNSLGRTYCLWLLCRELGWSPRIVGVRGDRIWLPLAGSDFLNADKPRAIGIVMGGHTGPIKVNGADYNSTMPALGLTDEQIASALTFVYSQWNNAGHEVTPAEVAAVRAQGAAKKK